MSLNKKEKIKIEFPAIFVSVNMQYGAGRRRGGYAMTFLTTDAKAYKEVVAWTAKTSYKGKIIEGPIKVSIWYYFPNKMRRDIQNDKLTLDSMEGIVYKDDKQVEELHLYKRFKKNNPYTKIVITKL